MSQLIDAILSIMDSLPLDDIMDIDPTWNMCDKYRSNTVTTTLYHIGDQSLTHISIIDKIAIFDITATFSTLLNYYTAKTAKVLRNWFCDYRAKSGIWTIMRKSLFMKLCELFFDFIHKRGGFIIDISDFISNSIQLLRLSENRDIAADMFHIGIKILFHMQTISAISICKIYIAMTKNDMEMNNADSAFDLLIDAWIAAKLARSTRYEAIVISLYLRMVVCMKYNKIHIMSKLRTKLSDFNFHISQTQFDEIYNILNNNNLLHVADIVIALLNHNDINSREIKLLLADIYMIIGTIISDNAQSVNLGLSFYNKAHDIYIDIGDYFGIGTVYISRATLAMKYVSDRHEMIENNIIAAHRIFLDFYILTSIANTLRLLSGLYSSLYNKYKLENNAELSQKFYTLAINNLNTSAQHFINIRRFEGAAACYFSIASLYDTQTNKTADIVNNILANYRLSYDLYKKYSDRSISLSINSMLNIIRVESANRYNTHLIPLQFEELDRLLLAMTKRSGDYIYNKNLISEFKIKYSIWNTPITQNKIVFGSGSLPQLS